MNGLSGFNEARSLSHPLWPCGRASAQCGVRAVDQWSVDSWQPKRPGGGSVKNWKRGCFGPPTAITRRDKTSGFCPYLGPSASLTTAGSGGQPLELRPGESSASPAPHPPHYFFRLNEQPAVRAGGGCSVCTALSCLRRGVSDISFTCLSSLCLSLPTLPHPMLVAVDDGTRTPDTRYRMGARTSCLRLPASCRLLCPYPQLSPGFCACVCV